MNDCIDRQELINRINKAIDCDTRDPIRIELNKLLTTKVMKIVDDLPSVSPQVPVGQWREDVDPARTWDRRRFYCSYCGGWQTYGSSDYCPNCGAKMEVNDEDTCRHS